MIRYEELGRPITHVMDQHLGPALGASSSPNIPPSDAHLHALTRLLNGLQRRARNGNLEATMDVLRQQPPGVLKPPPSCEPTSAAVPWPGDAATIS